MTIRLFAVGKLAKGYLKEGVEDYSTRIRRHCKFEVVEVAEGKSSNPRENEGKLLLEKLEKPGKLGQATYCIALKIGVPLYGFEELAGRLEALKTQGVSHFTFVIGGSEGLSPKVLQRADMQLSFSPLTFPHQLFRLLLCEQIYRCLKIGSGQTYQK